MISTINNLPFNLLLLFLDITIRMVGSKRGCIPVNLYHFQQIQKLFHSPLFGAKRPLFELNHHSIICSEYTCPRKLSRVSFWTTRMGTSVEQPAPSYGFYNQYHTPQASSRRHGRSMCLPLGAQWGSIADCQEGLLQMRIWWARKACKEDDVMGENSL